MPSPPSCLAPGAPPCLWNGSAGTYSPFGPLGGSLRFKRPRRRPLFYTRKNWFEWRRKAVARMNRVKHAQRHIWPRNEDPSEKSPSKGKGKVLVFRVKRLKLSLRRLRMYGRLIKGLHLQDAVDWISSIPVYRLQPIFQMLLRAQQKAMEIHHADPQRLYVENVCAEYGTPIKFLRMHKFPRIGILRSWLNALKVELRELPMEEYFHRLYVMGKVPRSLSADMRVSLAEKRVGPQMAREWYPYLSAFTRNDHRMGLKWLDQTRQFDYYKTRKEWIEKYKANLVRIIRFFNKLSGSLKPPECRLL
uniref:Uncharacterized protein n=1 Tax=Chromera velia CCMP2878 TaxID=1169474 RepID=A0A0K6S9U9_9ALVE|eukprot:Cvel_8160.t2-p1 / transcript=Cvel_8160.t2 / gene=Cvel_8160 / organism=Chromera_velia_CCMP2878 / gene_product=hypothetical protein / transcript_product=hypothetical protein / location=Cvel_scaffold444:49892-55001(+) / protein_length=303 / sequence_SO=supercontig / SO=protein_coding / is_pseudo=false